MKKVLCVFLIILIFTNGICFADTNNSLENHWAKDYIDRDFFNKYFSNIYNQNNLNFDFDKEISVEDFLYYLCNLIKDYDYIQNQNDITNTNFNTFFKENLIVDNSLNSEEILLRKDSVKIIIKTLKKEPQLLDRQLNNKYSDLEGLSDKYVYYILKATDLGIIRGYSDNTFHPNKPISKAEAIIILQRLKGELDMINNCIPFQIVKSQKSYNNKECISVEELKDKVIVNITKALPTSGYCMNAYKISKASNGEHNIYLRISKPDINMNVLQVITYYTISIEIQKKYLDNDKYIFNLVSNVNSSQNVYK